MKRIILITLTYFILTSSFGQNTLDGTYVGLEPICWTLKSGKTECYTDDLKPKRKWFHLTYLKVKGDSVFADQSPVNIYKRDTSYSSSDGAFYYYHGKVNRKATTVIIKLKLIYCDYCAVPTKDNPNAYLFPEQKNYTGKVTEQGLLINDYLFKRTTGKVMLSEHARASD